MAHWLHVHQVMALAGIEQHLQAPDSVPLVQAEVILVTCTS